MKYSKELKIGFFVVTVLVVSFFVINYLRGRDIFNRETEVVAYFDDIHGLVESAPVKVKGAKAGQVSEIEYITEEGRFKVTCSIKNVYRIPDDSKMTLFADGIMGGTAVRIDMGESDNYAEDGTELEPSYEPGMIDAIAGQAGELITKVNGAIDSLSVTVSGVNKLLGEENQARVANTLVHLEAAVKNVSDVAATINGRSADVDKFITDLVVLSAKLKVIADKTSVTVDGVNETVETLNQTVDNVNGTVTELRNKITETEIAELVASVNDLIQNINDPDGSIGKLLKDGSVYESLDALLIDIDSLVKKIEENPKKYMKLSVF